LTVNYQSRGGLTLRDPGIDGVLMFKLIAIDKTRSYVPETDFLVGGGSLRQIEIRCGVCQEARVHRAAPKAP
jgi:hypothetical protein